MPSQPVRVPFRRSLELGVPSNDLPAGSVGDLEERQSSERARAFVVTEMRCAFVAGGSGGAFDSDSQARTVLGLNNRLIQSSVSESARGSRPSHQGSSHFGFTATRLPLSLTSEII